MKNKSYKISVIVPVHNTEKYIKECINSIINQTLSDIEIICVDSSSDSTTAILHEYERKNNCIKLIKDSNNSYGYKINRGISVASGDYIGIVDADDYIEPDMFAVLFDTIKEQKVDFVKSDYSSFYVKDNKNIIKHYDNNIDLTYYNRVLNCKQNPEILYKNAVAIWTGLYKKDFLTKRRIKLNESEGASFQDTGFSVLTHILAESFFYINQSFYRYRTDNINSSVKSQKKYKTIMDECHWIESELDRKGIYDVSVRNAQLFNKIRSYSWNYYRLEKAESIKFAELIHPELQNQYVEAKIIYFMPEHLQKEFYDIYDMKDYYESENDMIATIDSALQTKNVALVCAGKEASKIAKYDKAMGINGVKAVFDNYATSMMSLGIIFSVSKTDDIKDVYDYYIVANKCKAYEIVKQLQFIGIDRKKIIVCEEFPEKTPFEVHIENIDTKDPIVSVIIPIYNVEKYIEDCLLSVEYQTFKDIEIICVNDGSSDSSLMFLEQFATKDKRIKIINQKNGGLANARNTGLSNAKGKYILFLDGDDMLRQDAVSRLVESANKFNTDMVYFDAKCLFEDKSLYDAAKESYYVRNKAYGFNTGKQLFAEMIHDGQFTDSACLMLYSAAFLNKNKLHFIEKMFYEDCYFSVLCFMKAKSVYHINEQFYIYRVRNNSIMTKPQNTAQYLYGRIVCLNKFNNFLQTEKLSAFQNQMLVTFTLVILSNCQRILKNISETELKKFFSFPNVEMMKFELCISGMDSTLFIAFLTLNKIMNNIQSADTVYIYGAGKRGKRFLEYLYLQDSDKKISGFIVSDRANNPEYIHGIPVKSIDSVEIKHVKNPCVIISPRGNNEEIIELCRNNGFNNIFNLNDELFSLLKA